MAINENTPLRSNLGDHIQVVAVVRIKQNNFISIQLKQDSPLPPLMPQGNEVSSFTMVYNMSIKVGEMES